VIFTLKNDSNNENFEVTSANCHMSICENVYKNSVIDNVMHNKIICHK
jgi:hypothetical protein